MPTFNRSLASAWRALLLPAAFLAAALAVLPAQAAYTFTKVIDSQTIDSTNGQYNNFGAVALSGDNVAFFGSYSSSSTSAIGILGRIDGSLQSIATFAGPTSNVPGGGTFNALRVPKISGSTTVIYGNYRNSTGTTGIFTSSAGNLSAVARDGGAYSTAPGIGTFTALREYAIGGNTTVFAADYMNGAAYGNGIFTSTNGVISPAILAGASAPGGGTFSYFLNVDISGDRIAFYGETASSTVERGVYIKNGATLTAVARTSGTLAAVPGGGTFTNFYSTSIDGNLMAFSGAYTGGTGTSGVFVSNNGVLTKIATNADSGIPGVTFNGLGYPSVGGETVAFSVAYTGGDTQAIYASYNGVLAPVVQVGDTLFGGTIAAINFNENGCDNNRIAFNYRLTTGVSGVAIASLVPVTVPEAGTLWLAIPTLGLVAVFVRRRKK